MTRKRLDLGVLGEKLALKEIRARGYRSIIRNYSCKLGEIDLIARDEDTLVFIEVKTRRNRSTGYAKEAVNLKKRRQLSKVALYYMKTNEYFDSRARFDVIAVNVGGGEPEIEIVKNAFELEY